MKILDVLTSPWAILPEKLLEIQNIYATHLRGEKIDIKQVEAAIGRPLVNEPKGYEQHGGVGVVRLEGVLARRMNLFSRMSGGTSTELALAQFREALADREAESILLVIDSPGGAVDGTQELAEAIYNARGKKPIKALATGTVASAAYWIAAAAEEVLIASDTTLVGSIGVVATHVDVSRAEDRLGVKTTEITAGRYKRIASQYGPLTQEGRASIQEMVDAIYTAFVNDVAAFRRVSADRVLDGMADGRIFLGKAAQDVGLVDGFASEHDLLGKMRRGQTTGVGKRAAGSAGRKLEGHRMDADDMMKGLTLDALKAGNPELYKAIADEGQAKGRTEGMAEGMAEGHKVGFEEGCAKGRQEGRSAAAEEERQRIRDVESQALPGHEALIESMKWDGQTTGAQAAIKILQAEREARGTRLTQIKREAPPVLVPSVVQPGIETAGNPEGASKEEKANERDKAIKAYQAEHQVDYRTAALAVSKSHPGLFKDR